MREIKFRGKRVDNGEWVYGDLVHKALTTDNRIAVVGIKPHGCYAIEVSISTIGQYTGLKDKNGVEIFEWDILELRFNGTLCCQPSAVQWQQSGGRWVCEGMAHNDRLDRNEAGCCEVIGTIYDKETP